ncbi:MAG: hypothetical protein C0490_15790, partial [Marivirga sp.]|nr:hypothetical protein [Marivirga sp.]
KIHLMATMIATLTILTFLVASVVAEFEGNEDVIKNTKKVILFSLPILVISMSTLGISGNRLAGQSQNVIVIGKKKRMKFIVMNGIFLITLASILYYRSHYQAIDSIFIGLQIAEFAFGLTNLILIGLNAKGGLHLSGKLGERTVDNL